MAKINELKLITNEIGEKVNSEPKTFLEVAMMSILNDEVDWDTHFLSGRVISPWEGCAYRNVVGFVTVDPRRPDDKLVALNIPLHGSPRYRPLCLAPADTPEFLQDGGSDCRLAHGVFRLKDLIKVMGMSWAEGQWGDHGLPSIPLHLFDEVPPHDTFITMYLMKQLGLSYKKIFKCSHCDEFITDLNGIFLSYHGEGGVGISCDQPVCSACAMILSCQCCGQIYDNDKFTNLNEQGECACCFTTPEDFNCIVCGEPITDVYWLIESAGREAFEDSICINCAENERDLDV